MFTSNLVPTKDIATSQNFNLKQDTLNWSIKEKMEGSLYFLQNQENQNKEFLSTNKERKSKLFVSSFHANRLSLCKTKSQTKASPYLSNDNTIIFQPSSTHDQLNSFSLNASPLKPKEDNKQITVSDISKLFLNPKNQSISHENILRKLPVDEISSCYSIKGDIQELDMFNQIKNFDEDLAIENKRIEYLNSKGKNVKQQNQDIILD